MSTTQQDLDTARARRAQQASPGAAVGNVAGTGAGLAAGNYVANTMLGGGGSGASGIGSGSLTVTGSVPPPGTIDLAASPPLPGAEVGMGGYIAPLAVGAIGAYTAKKGLEGYQAGEGEGPMGGFKAGLKAAGPLKFVPVLGQAPAIGGMLGGMFGSGKDKDQMGRDQVRKAMQQQGGIDEAFNVSLADGTKFNIGLDGGGVIKTKSGKEISPYNVDTDNPFAHQSVAWADPIAAILTGGDPKLRSDFAGYFTNAAMSNANTLEGVRANILNIMAAHKLDFATARQAVDSMLAAGKIDQQTRDIYMNSLGIIESGDAKRYDTRTVQQVQQEMAAAKPPTPAPSTPLAPPPTNAPAATTGVPRVTAPPPQQPATVAGQPVSAFQKLIDEAKRREQMSGVTNGR